MKLSNCFSSRSRFMRFAARVCLVSAILVVAAAPAPRGSIQYAGQILKKIETSQPPNYPADFWTDRFGLLDDIGDVVRVMADRDNVDPDTWCSMQEEIWDLATLTNAYFDIGQTTNPALDDFKKDWLKVMQLSGCLD